MFTRFVVLLLTSMLSTTSWSMSCSEYNSKGPNVKSLEELHEHQITKAQIDLVRKNTALKAGRVSTLQFTPIAIKLKKIMNNKAQMAELAGGTSTLVRIDCFKNPNKDFYEAVSEQFEFAVEHISNKYK